MITGNRDDANNLYNPDNLLYPSEPLYDNSYIPDNSSHADLSLTMLQQLDYPSIGYNFANELEVL